MYHPNMIYESQAFKLSHCGPDNFSLAKKKISFSSSLLTSLHVTIVYHLQVSFSLAFKKKTSWDTSDFTLPVLQTEVKLPPYSCVIWCFCLCNPKFLIPVAMALGWDFCCAGPELSGIPCAPQRSFDCRTVVY